VPRPTESARLRATLAERDQEIARLLRELETRSEELVRQNRTLALRTSRLQADRSTIDTLNTRLAEQSAGADARETGLRAALDGARQELARVDESVIWQLFLRTRERLFRRLGGEGSPPVRAIQAALRAVGRWVGAGLAAEQSQAADAAQAAPPEAPIVFPAAAAPVVSIIMPVHSRADLTRGALESILHQTPFPEYEVVIVEDRADAETVELLRAVRGAEIIHNPENLGYQESVAAGAARARGSWLVLCNNDIVVRPGWLDALLECAESSSDVGIVAPKYLFPDGTIAEAGAILWRDGSGANYLRGEPGGSCHAAYRREIDYGSAAALLVRASLWRELGGFDQRFAPMYYEDADLCFAARARGWRVMYEPRAEVIHFEGSTAGTDEAAGHKRHQAANRPRFARKWRAALESGHQENNLERWWAAAERGAGPRVLVVDHTVPTWDMDAGSLRMRAILRSLREMGCRVTLLPDNNFPLQPYTRELENSGIEVLYGGDAHETVRRLGPDLDLVILSRPHPAARWLDPIRAFAPRARVLYDTVDLHWLREARGAAIAQGKEEELVLTPRAAAMREIESALMRATDGTIVVTDAEGLRVQDDVPGTRVHVLPIGNPVRTTVPTVADRDGVVFVGGFRHPPNVDAAMLLASAIMPLVWRELPDLRLTIVGPEPPRELLALTDERIDVRGWVSDLTPVLDGARGLLAPLRYGAGLKGKVTQALAEGLPVVTTPIGAEGLAAIDGVDLLIGDSPETLAAHTVSLVEDDALWTRLSQAGRDLIAASCSTAVLAERLHELLPPSRSRV
jgi:GT2 family glycosyltransferase